MEQQDQGVKFAIQTFDDLTKTLNLLAGRIREWYSLIFPELNRLVEDHIKYLYLAEKFGRTKSSPNTRGGTKYEFIHFISVRLKLPINTKEITATEAMIAKINTVSIGSSNNIPANKSAPVKTSY